MRLNFVALTTLVVLAIDLTTKSLAMRRLSTNSVTHLGPLDLRLVYNLGSTTHPYHSSLTYLLTTRLLVAALLVAIFFVLKSRVATVGIGLLFGALLGNFLNLVISPHKVTDFLMLGPVWTANLADFCAFAGILIMACSIAVRFVKLIRSIETKRPATAEQLA
jgi:lipoprotein signal peptidase